VSVIIEVDGERVKRFRAAALLSGSAKGAIGKWVRRSRALLSGLVCDSAIVRGLSRRLSRLNSLLMVLNRRSSPITCVVLGRDGGRSFLGTTRVLDRCDFGMPIGRSARSSLLDAVENIVAEGHCDLVWMFVVS